MCLVIEGSATIGHGQVRTRDDALGESLSVYGADLPVAAPSHERQKSKLGALDDLLVHVLMNFLDVVHNNLIVKLARPCRAAQ